MLYFNYKTYPVTFQGGIAMKDPKRFLYETRPVAVESNCVSGDKYRFTVLTPFLIRAEYSENGQFEDRASQSVFFRDFAKNNFETRLNGGVLEIETEALVLTYKENAEFKNDTLKFKLKISPATTYNFGDDFETLGGTASTLDAINGSIAIGDGICSQNGFSVLDDSNTMLLNGQRWVEVRTPDTKDIYFFGYGYNYKDAVKDFYRLTGIPPMLPAYALGNWWSRYHRYTQQEYQDLIKQFEAKNIPFSVSVVDMDWHIVDIPEELKHDDKRFTTGWTGYTWNEELFPDYKAFLNFLHDHNLKTALNLHPAQGICKHEAMYKEMAEKCGIDPESGERIAFDVLSPEFMENYFDVLHHPYEEDGVDFWWMDWQQGRNYWWIHEANVDGKMQDEREVLDPLWMLNHLHIADIKRNGKRPMFFSRFSGPGSQRYPVGFSGDTFITWKSLDFQPYFTATASNIGYSWWSHDIGGHHFGHRDEEMVSRWMQLGVFSPINRLHSTSNDFIKKEPWCFDEKTEKNITNWLQLRHKLFPYNYTMNYRTTKHLEPIVQPMYYDYPQCGGAYDVKKQFMFGSELMVAPITQANDYAANLGGTECWFPKGDWFDFFNGMRYSSSINRKLKVFRKITEYPVFAKSGAIVPMQNSFELKPDSNMDVVVFPNASNSFTLYEDAGDGPEFENGAFAETKLALAWGEKPVFTISPATGDTSLIPSNRNWKIIFRGFNENVTAKAFVGGKDVTVNTEFDKDTRSLILTVNANVTEEIKVELSGETLVTDNGSLYDRCFDILEKARCGYQMKTDALWAAVSDLPVRKVMFNLWKIFADTKDTDIIADVLEEQIRAIQ